jgi:IS1 family transposase
MNRNTIMSLLVTAGQRCAQLMDEKLRGLKCDFIQADEIWCFVNKKQKRCREHDSAEFGDAWVFVAIDPVTKLVPSFTVGKRSAATTKRFISDLAERVDGKMQLTTDGFRFYVDAVEKSFGATLTSRSLWNCMAIMASMTCNKIFSIPDSRNHSQDHSGKSRWRENLHQPRWTAKPHHADDDETVYAAHERFQQEDRNLIAAVSLHFAYYNFCRVHSTLRVTPAMEAGITDHIWSIQELLG